VTTRPDVGEDLGLRAFLLAVSLLPGVLLGLFLNMCLYLFHSVILGWGDSAPDWYVKTQGSLQVAVMAASVLACIVLSQRLYRKRMRKNASVAVDVTQR
jgi:xanthine/uracil permease